MFDYLITTSSTADLTADYLKQHDIPCIEYTLTLDGKEYSDDRGLSISYQDLYNAMRAGKTPTTSMVNSTNFEAFFREQLKQGKDILHIEFSSNGSASFSNAAMVVQQLNEEHDNKIYLLDSLAFSRGMGLMVDYAIQNREKGLSLKDNFNWLEDNKQHFIHWFTVDDLNHLRRGGRVSGLSAVLGTMLNIKPILSVNPEGRLIPCFKVRGRKNSILGMVEHMKEDIAEPDGQTVFICHGDCIEDAEFLKNAVMQAFPSITDVQIGYTGMVVGCHSGPGTLALFYKGKARYDTAKK